MTTEEKARAYDEALEKAKEHINSKGIGDTVDLCKHLFPELVESEDERIRKELIELIGYFRSRGINQHLCDECLVYLERQKPSFKQIHDSAIWDSGLRTGIELGKQKEFVSEDFESIWKTEDCKTLLDEGEKLSPRFKELFKEICHSWYDKGIEVGVKQKEPKLLNNEKYQTVPIEILDRLYASEQELKEIKQKEQKPAEWTKEDETMLNNLIWAVHMKSISPLDEMDDRDKCERYEKFLTYLPERFNLQLKQEWSDEDKRMIDTIVSVLGQYIDHKTVSDTNSGDATPRYSKKIFWLRYSKEISWLKSLSSNFKNRNEDVVKLCSNEWSEEDEEKINNISEIIEHCIYNGRALTLSKEYKKELQRFLKSLRPQLKCEIYKSMEQS